MYLSKTPRSGQSAAPWTWLPLSFLTPGHIFPLIGLYPLDSRDSSQLCIAQSILSFQPIFRNFLGVFHSYCFNIFPHIPGGTLFLFVKNLFWDFILSWTDLFEENTSKRGFCDEHWLWTGCKQILCSRRWLLVDCFSLGGIGVYTWFASSCLLFSFLFTVTTFMGGDLILVFFCFIPRHVHRFPCGIWFGCVGLLFLFTIWYLGNPNGAKQLHHLYTQNKLMVFDNKIRWKLANLVGGRLEEPSWIGINFDIGDSSDKLTFPMLAPILFFLTHSHPLTAMNAFHAHTSLNPSVQRYAVLRHR